MKIGVHRGESGGEDAGVGMLAFELRESSLQMSPGGVVGTRVAVFGEAGIAGSVKGGREDWGRRAGVHRGRRRSGWSAGAGCLDAWDRLQTG